jgi:cyanophycinase-like exopeptidase
MAGARIILIFLGLPLLAASDQLSYPTPSDDDFKPSQNSLVIVERDYEYICFPNDACSEDDTVIRATSGGSVLMGGGTDVDAAFEWQISRAGGGDFVVLRESGTDAYNTWIYDLGQGAPAGLRTVTTIILKSPRASSDAFVLSKVQNAEALFFAGGDQSNYVGRIAGRPLDALVRGKAAHITVGGTSAGLAIQGLWIYAAFHGSVTSAVALADPYSPELQGELVASLLSSPLVNARALTDSHFATRDRMGRMVTFMARIWADGFAGDPATDGPVRAVGVDEKTALLLEPSGVLTAAGNGTAYMCALSAASFGASVVAAGQPLTVPGVACERLQAAGFADLSAALSDGDTFDLGAWAGTGVPYTFDITNGSIVGSPYGPP